jgi:hypothetical protein
VEVETEIGLERSSVAASGQRRATLAHLVAVVFTTTARVFESDGQRKVEQKKAAVALDLTALFNTSSGVVWWRNAAFGLTWTCFR